MLTTVFLYYCNRRRNFYPSPTTITITNPEKHISQCYLVFTLHSCAKNIELINLLQWCLFNFKINEYESIYQDITI